MCGKPNPEEAETCKYCQARLKPFINPAKPGLSDQTRRITTLTGRNASEIDSSLPDWLKDLRSPQDQNANEMPSAEDQPEEAPEDNTSSKNEPKAPDWINRIQPQSEQKPANQVVLPDWLANLGTSGQPPVRSKFQAEDETGGEETEHPKENEPDWLRRIRARQRGENPDEEEHADVETVLPGSLPSTPSRSFAQLPEWLSNLGKQETAFFDKAKKEDDRSILGEAQPPAAEEIQATVRLNQSVEKKVDAFFSEQGAFSAESESAVETDQSVAALELAGAAGDEAKPESAPKAISTLPLPDEGLPDWLARLDAASEKKGQGESVPAFVVDEETTPDFSELEKAASRIETPDLNTLPDWISRMPVEDAIAEETGNEVTFSTPATPFEADSLTRAELPSWLKAMRPVEAAVPYLPRASSQAKIEKAGPLAGLRGALSAEPGMAALQKPKAFSVKLQLTENQQAHMAMLEEMLKTEGEAKPTTLSPVVSTQYVIRILVALILLLAVLAPLWINKNAVPMPNTTLIPAEVKDADRLIARIAPGEPVLLAFEYEPGLSGELDISTATVIEKLMSQGAYLAIVSTNVSGPLLAERTLNTIAVKKGTPYSAVTNLGYIPGGSSALLGLAENPRQALPYDLKSIKVWDTAPLANIKNLADFSLVVVFTEKADTARGWVEQVLPTLRKKNTPLVMVVSAQAEPMLQPYYETNPKQISGMISGLTGFAAYESITGQTGPARSYWDAYNAGMLAAASLFLLGGLMYGGIVLFSPRKRDKDEGAE
jgi:hypothetical protein